MNYIEYLARTICEQLEGDSPAVLASIVSQQGSAPRNTGTKMVIGADGKGYGTIGGSLLESTSIKKAREVISLKKPAFLEFDLSADRAESKGMICGGKTTVLLDYIAPIPENRKFFKSLKAAILSGGYLYLVTYLAGPNENLRHAGRVLIFPDGKMTGNTPLSPSDNERLNSELRNISSVEVLTFGNLRAVVDRIQKVTTLYCFGAGHVAVPTAHIASLAGFRVIVLDDRPEFASMEHFPDASSIRVIENFDHAFNGLDIDSDSFLVILTRGHQFDQAVLEQALRTKAGYIGMISSKRKKEAIFNILMAKGFAKEVLERVHSPIGISIGAQTPEEIAVSIVAELIDERQRTRV